MSEPTLRTDMDRPVVLPDIPAPRARNRFADPSAPPAPHRIQMVERGPFTVARCTGCGWESFARRSRPLARAEGLDHARLYANTRP
jgi:hypothetical protein